MKVSYPARSGDSGVPGEVGEPSTERSAFLPLRGRNYGSVLLNLGIFVRDDTLDAEHVSLFSLATFAYNLRDVQLSGGPAWVTSGVLASSAIPARNRDRPYDGRTQACL